MTTTSPKDGDMRVWWVPQIPMCAFYVAVPDLKTAKLIHNTLAQYDLFQFNNSVKPDYCNAGGLEVFADNEWTEWEDADGYCIDDTEVLTP